MEKYLVSIKLQYNAGCNKKITIGVYDTFDDACINGNKVLETLESKFKLHVFPNGVAAKKERFTKTGGCFGSRVTLIGDLAYLKTPFRFFLSIETLSHKPIESCINDVLDEIVKYRNFIKETENNDDSE